MNSSHTDIKRRRIVQMAGISTAGIVGFSGQTLGEEDDANVTIEVPDQLSDGETILIESFETDIDGVFHIFQDTDERLVYKTMEIEAGTEFTNREIELDDLISESQSIRTSLYPIGGGRSYDTRSSQVSISETADSPRSVGTPYGTEPGVQKIEADPDAGFHSPYFLYTPEFDSVEESVTDSQERPLVVTAYPWGEFEQRVEGAQRADGGITGRIADEMNCPMMSVPLALTEGFVGLEPQELTLAHEIEITDPQRERVDLQFMAMIDDAKSRLNRGTFTVADKIHYDGGSSAADFIDRIAPLHPEHIRAFSAGGNGYMFLPFEEITNDIPVYGDPEKTVLPYPIGAGNLEELTGEAFNKEAWMNIEQFRWIGGEDQDPTDPDSHSSKRFRGHRRREISQVVEEVFGTLQVDDRFETSGDIYGHLDVPAMFRIFEGQPHSPEFEYRLEAVDFHKEQIKRDFELVHVTIQDSPSEANIGDTVPVRVVVQNQTGVESSTTISLAVDATEVETMDIPVDPRSTETVELETTFNETGEFTLSINGTATEDPVVVTEETTGGDDGDSAETDTEESSTDADTGEDDSATDPDEATVEDLPGFGIVQALTAIGGIGYLLNRRLSDDD